MAQVVVELAQTSLAVLIALIVLRTLDLLLKRRFPAISGALEYAIGQH